ncbi:alpha/beta hydrolase family protein [Flavivirga jejuensis]|uniref:Prolyl oligopeptidase family serine peptidase n=1 Tax=Flavivirga jejuensis TaxID=870487 RepID=A0ABT8WIS2_9FLAO|nr:prolyl oligopeptidase family serine peptidase [Flavivirga jejuensis]MDO5972968.1 prolyl oligopeptidase family serine peptidase [Flavivirga jejuensis]
MYKIVIGLLLFNTVFCLGQEANVNKKDVLMQQIVSPPSQQEIHETLINLRQKDLLPKDIVVHDSIILSNMNKLFILSHTVEGNKHYGAVIVPKHSEKLKLPVIIFATGGDGIHTEFDVSQDFNHKAIQFPNYLGEKLDKEFIVVIPSFRGQQLIIDGKKYQSEGNIGDAFDGATTDALAFLNVVLEIFNTADEHRIAIFGGSRGGTVSLLASARDKRIKKTVVVAAPTDMAALYDLYPQQFKLLFFNYLLNGKISEIQARKRFIASSPIYFTKELSFVQLHHDENDPFVPVSFAGNLIKKMEQDKTKFCSYFYNEGIHGFWDNENYWKRVQEFLGSWIKE